MYSNYQPALIKLDNENIGGHRYIPLQSIHWKNKRWFPNTCTLCSYYST